MPELPEVEVVRRDLTRLVAGRAAASVAVLHPRAVRRHLHGAHDFVARLTGRRFLKPARRGKYLWVPLDSGEVLVAHLGMSGQLLIRPASAPDEVHLRVRVALTGDSTELRFVDQRMFGVLLIESIDPDSGLPSSIKHIAADPFDPEFDEEKMFRALRRRHSGLKRALLDQTLVSGIGNIYADEALWRAQLHYARPTETLTRREIRRLFSAAREVMAAAFVDGGTSFDTHYVNVSGESGYFGRSLAVYGRAGQPCPRCGTPIRRDRFMNRSSYTCPKCQPRPRRARW